MPNWKTVLFASLLFLLSSCSNSEEMIVSKHFANRDLCQFTVTTPDEDDEHWLLVYHDATKLDNRYYGACASLKDGDLITVSTYSKQAFWEHGNMLIPLK